MCTINFAELTRKGRLCWSLRKQSCSIDSNKIMFNWHIQTNWENWPEVNDATGNAMMILQCQWNDLVHSFSPTDVRPLTNQSMSSIGRYRSLLGHGFWWTKFGLHVQAESRMLNLVFYWVKELSFPGASASHRGVKTNRRHKFQLPLVTLSPMTCEVTGPI